MQGLFQLLLPLQLSCPFNPTELKETQPRISTNTQFDYKRGRKGAQASGRARSYGRGAQPVGRNKSVCALKHRASDVEQRSR